MLHVGSSLGREGGYTERREERSSTCHTSLSLSGRYGACRGCHGVVGEGQ